MELEEAKELWLKADHTADMFGAREDMHYLLDSILEALSAPDRDEFMKFIGKEHNAEKQDSTLAL